MGNRKVLVVATSRKTRGGITSVVKAHETGEQWNKFHCKWIETHRDGYLAMKLWYLFTALIEYILILPFYDIVHIHIATTQSARRKKLFYLLARLMKKKIIFHFHPSNEKFLFEKNVNTLYRQLFNNADKILVLSEQWIRWLEEALGEGVWRDKIQVLYNPCPIVRRDSNYKKKQILFAGTLMRRKGYDVLLRAFGKIANKYPDWTVAFAGVPNGEDGFDGIEDGKKICSELNITNQVKWLGWISGESKERVFNESSIYCLASEGEGFPMGLLDAWAYGLPCVMTPVGGIPDIVKNNVEGLIFPVGDVDSLANAIERMICYKELRESIISSSDKLVYNEFNIKNICRKLENIYTRI